MILKTLSEYLVKLSRAETQYSSSAYIPEHESNNMSPSTAITPNSKSQAEDQKSGDEYLVSSNNVDSPDVSQDGDDVTKDVAPMGTKKALIAWLILCYSTGPTSSVAFTYVSAAMQSLTNLVGHVPGSTRACATRGTIRCVVKFGGGEINYASYVLYLNAIGRAMEGILTILISGVADYSYYRKRLMMGSIFLFGTIALPFAGLTGQSYSYLTALSVLYCCLTTIQGVYVVIEASYIPIFMRSVGWFKERPRIEHGDVDPSAEEVANRTKRHVFKKGARVSVLGLVASNVGGMTALLIGIVITYTRGTPRETGYHNFLLAITIAGSITICFAIIGGILLPSVPGKTKPPGTNLALLPFQRWLRTIKSIQKYPQAFKLCIGWILWNTGYSNFLSVNSLLFREVSGLTVGTGVYTVWQFTAIIFAVMGSLTWMFTFPLFKFPVKRWAYFFLSVNIACVLWGCIGIADVSIGYKHVAEFWVEQVLFMSTSSALRSFNRVLYSSMLPRGAEAQFFGLEITLDLATGWINPLVQGVIQDRTGNLRFPMIPNLCLMVIALCIYIWVDVEQGIEDAKQEME